MGQAIEELYPDRVEEQPDVLAHHYSLAEQWPAAVRYGRHAARKARDLSQYADEVRILETVRHGVTKLAPSEDRRALEIEVLPACERAYESVGDHEAQHGMIEALLSLIDPAVHRRQLAETLIRQSF